MAQLSPEERRLQASLAVHESWARTQDRSERTRPAREALLRRFEREVDPDGVLDPEERQRRAEHARSAHYSRMALKRAKAQRLRAEADHLEAEVDESGDAR